MHSLITPNQRSFPLHVSLHASRVLTCCRMTCCPVLSDRRTCMSLPAKRRVSVTTACRCPADEAASFAAASATAAADRPGADCACCRRARACNVKPCENPMHTIRTNHEAPLTCAPAPAPSSCRPPLCWISSLTVSAGSKATLLFAKAPSFEIEGNVGCLAAFGTNPSCFIQFCSNRTQNQSAAALDDRHASGIIIAPTRFFSSRLVHLVAGRQRAERL